MNIKKLIYFSIIAGFISFVLIGCAHVVAPTGGPRDEDPPVIIASEPENYSINFQAEKVSIEFDEYVKLDDIKSNLLVSPIMEENPEITVKGKSIEIKFEEELQDSTTYNIYFADAIQDYNEGNPIENFQYIFSTGSFIDSLSLHGHILDAFNLKPVEDAFVMLYSEFDDSIPLLQIPEYLSKTDEEGYFEINNIRQDSFKIFVLVDQNMNYLFDIPEEQIGFLDSALTFELDYYDKKDTLYSFLNDSSSARLTKQQIDTLFAEGMIYDTTGMLEIDTIIDNSFYYFPSNEYHILTFLEYKPIQYLLSYSRDERKVLSFVLNKPGEDSISLTLLDSIDVSEWYFLEENTRLDTFLFWITDSSVYNLEEINVELGYTILDSVGEDMWTRDTLKMKYFEEEPESDMDEEVPVAEEFLNLSFSVKQNSKMHLNKDIVFHSATPLSTVDSTLLRLYEKTDTVFYPKDYTIEPDSQCHRYHIDFEKNEDALYKLTALPGAITDIYNHINDTIDIDFSIQKLDYYGILIANITGTDSTRIIIQLLNPSDEKVLREHTIDYDQKTTIPFVDPKEYLIKVIVDKNMNGKWDTGDYLNHLQPEPVYYYKEVIKIRSNWDYEISWDLKE